MGNWWSSFTKNSCQSISKYIQYTSGAEGCSNHLMASNVIQYWDKRKIKLNNLTKSFNLKIELRIQSTHPKKWLNCELKITNLTEHRGDTVANVMKNANCEVLKQFSNSFLRTYNNFNHKFQAQKFVKSSKSKFKMTIEK